MTPWVGRVLPSFTFGLYFTHKNKTKENGYPENQNGPLGLPTYYPRQKRKAVINTVSLFVTNTFYNLSSFIFYFSVTNTPLHYLLTQNLKIGTHLAYVNQAS